MNIAFVSEPLFPIGGTANRTINLAKALAERGHKVQIILPQFKMHSIDGIEIVPVKPFMMQKYGSQRRNEYLKFLLKNGISAITNSIKNIDRDTMLHYVNYYMALTRIISWRRPSNPFLYDLQASAYHEANNFVMKKLTKRIEKTLVETGDLLVPTKELADYFKHNYNVSDERITPVPLAVDTNLQRASNPIKELIHKPGVHLAVYHGSPYVTNIEALIRVKKIAKKVNESGINLKVLVLGHVGEHVSSPFFIKPGYVEDLDSYIAQADLALLPIDSGSLGMRTRVLDYMRNSVPVIAYRDGLTGFNQAIQDKALISVEHLDDMIESVKKHITDTSSLVRLTERSQSYLEKYHSYGVVGEILESVYDNIQSERLF